MVLPIPSCPYHIALDLIQIPKKFNYLRGHKNLSWFNRFEFQNKNFKLSLVLGVRLNLAFSKKIQMLYMLWYLVSYDYCPKLPWLSSYLIKISLILYYRVSHRYCSIFVDNFTKSGTRYLQKNNIFVKFETLTHSTSEGIC